MDSARRRSAGDPMDEETIARRRSRRVSFADTTAVHVFERDESTDTPPKRTSSSSPFSSGGKSTVQGAAGTREGSDSEDEEDDEDRPSEMFVKDFGDGFSPGSASAASMASNDDDNFFGPVSTSFLKSGRFSDSGISENNENDDDDDDDDNSNHDITMDSTAFSLRFNKIQTDDTSASSAGHLITPPISVLSDRAKKTASNVKSNEGISDFSLIGNNSSKYDFGRLSPTLDNLLKEVDEGLKPTSDENISMDQIVNPNSDENISMDQILNPDSDENISMDQILNPNSDENISMDQILNPNSDEHIPTAQIQNPNSHQNIPTDQIQNPNSHQNIPINQVSNPNSHQNNPTAQIPNPNSHQTIPPSSPQVPPQTKTLENTKNTTKNEIKSNIPKSPAVLPQSPLTSIQNNNNNLEKPKSPGVKAGQSSPGSIQSLKAKRLQLFNEAGLSNQSIDSENNKHNQRISAIKDSILRKSPKVIESGLSTRLNFEDNEHGTQNDDLKSVVRNSPKSARNALEKEIQDRNNNNEILLRTPKSPGVQLFQASPNSTRAQKLQLLGEAVLSIGSELFMNLDQPISAISDSILVQSPISKSVLSPNRLDFDNEKENENQNEGLYKEFDFEGRKRRLKMVLERESPVKKVKRNINTEMNQDSRIESVYVDSKELFSNLKDITSQIFSPSIQKYALHELDLLLSLLERLHMASKFNTFSSVIKDCNSSDPHQEKLAEAKMLHYNLIYEKSKLELNKLKLAKLQAEADGVSERAIEVCSLKSKILEFRNSNHKVSNIENDIPKEEHEKLILKKQEVESVQKKLKDLTVDFQVLYKIPETLNCDEMIKIVRDNLKQKKLHLAIQQDLRLWKLHETIKKDDQNEIILNYCNFLFQRFIFRKDKSRNTIHVNNTLNKTKIEQNFINMNAYVAFDFVFSDTKKDLKYISQETMETGLVFGNLLKILEEIQDAKIELLNLISTNFESKLSEKSFNKLELNMVFMNFTNAKKLSFTLDLSDLKHAIYPSESFEERFEINRAETTINESVLSEILDSIKNVELGPCMILRLCKTVSKIVSSYV